MVVIVYKQNIDFCVQKQMEFGRFRVLRGWERPGEAGRGRVYALAPHSFSARGSVKPKLGQTGEEGGR